MRKNKMKVIGIAVAFIIVGFIYCLFSHSGYKNYDNNESYKNLIGILKDISSSEEEAKISQEDINIIGTSYLKSQQISGKLKIDGINLNIDKEEISIKIPVKYKIFPLLLSTSGKVNVSDKDIIYTPDYFKVGMLKISNNTVFNIIKKHFAGKIEVKDTNLILKKDKLLKKEIQLVRLDKECVILKGDNKTKSIIKKAENIVNGVENKAGKDNATGKKNDNNGNLKDKQNKTSGDKFFDSHGSAESKANQIIALANQTISMLQSNPHYNYWKNVNKAKAIYDTLSAEEKKWVKRKVLNSVDLNTARKLKKKYGL